MRDWDETERVGHFSGRAQAQLACSLLADRGIRAEVVADDVAGMHPELTLATGGACLRVPRDQVEEARRVLEEAEGVDPVPPRRLALGWRLLGVAAAIALLAMVVSAVVSLWA